MKFWLLYNNKNWNYLELSIERIGKILICYIFIYLFRYYFLLLSLFI